MTVYSNFRIDIHSGQGIKLAERTWLDQDADAPLDNPTLAASRPRVLLLHYFGGSSREWKYVAPQLAESGFFCIAPDARGHGDSSAAGLHDGYTVHDMALDVQRVSKHYQLSAHPAGWVLVGHSMGGKTALEVAASQPAGLLGLILIAPSPPTPQPMSDEERKQEIDSYGDAAASEKNAAKIAVAPLTREQTALFVEDNLRTAKSAWIAWNESGTRKNISAEMPKITLPTLLIIGAGDPVIPREAYEREVAGRLPNLTRQEIVRGAGHLVTMTHAVEVANIITSWIASLF